MVRLNENKQIIDYENSIKKSNEFSMAKLSHRLTLNQMQLLAYAIYSTQQDGKTEFRKADFEKKFELGEYRTEDAKKDSRRLFELEFSLDDIESDEFYYLHVFQKIHYKKGLFTFLWSEDMIPHILDLQQHYIIDGFPTLLQFKSSFSWILYDYLKAQYPYWYKPISKEALMKLFGVEDKKTYQNNTGVFKQKVLDVAIAEINEHTELEVSYKEEKKGRKIVGFLLRWSTGKLIKGATENQIKQLNIILDVIDMEKNTFAHIKNEKSKQKAILLMKELKRMKKESSSSYLISSEEADKMISRANDILKELDAMMQNHDKSKRDTSFYYNWLKEDAN